VFVEPEDPGQLILQILGSFRKKRRRQFLSLLLWRLSKAHTRSATVLVDELHASRFQRMANSEVIRCCHGRLAVGQFGAADRSDAQ
jgi:hypothetical protein